MSRLKWADVTDIRLVPVVYEGQQYGLPPLAVTFDWLMTPLGELDTTNELATAVIVALGTDRLANTDDDLPGMDDTDRRGWWGDLDAEELHDGWPIGTRLWLISRAKLTDIKARQGSTVGRAREYVQEALQPLIDRRIADQIDVEAGRVGTDRIDVGITIWRGPEPALSLRYSTLWNEISNPPAASSAPPVIDIVPALPTIPPNVTGLKFDSGDNSGYEILLEDT